MFLKKQSQITLRQVPDVCGKIRQVTKTKASGGLHFTADSYCEKKIIKVRNHYENY